MEGEREEPGDRGRVWEERKDREEIEWKEKGRKKMLRGGGRNIEKERMVGKNR